MSSREPHMATSTGARCSAQRVQLTLHRADVRCDECRALLEQDDRQLSLFRPEETAAPRRVNARGHGRT